MAKVNLTPFASSMHVEGETGGGGGGELFQIYFNYSSETETWNCSEKLDDIIAAYKDGKIIVGIIYHSVYWLGMIFVDEGFESVHFSGKNFDEYDEQYISSINFGVYKENGSDVTYVEFVDKPVGVTVLTTDLSYIYNQSGEIMLFDNVQEMIDNGQDIALDWDGGSSVQRLRLSRYVANESITFSCIYYPYGYSNQIDFHSVSIFDNNNVEHEYITLHSN